MDTALLGFLAVAVINLVAVSVLMGRQMQMVRAHEQYHKEHFLTHKTVARVFPTGVGMNQPTLKI